MRSRAQAQAQTATMLTHDQLRNQAFDNPDVRARFDELRDAFAQLDEVLSARIAVVKLASQYPPPAASAAPG